MDLSEHTNYELEDQLYDTWIQSVRDGHYEPDTTAEENDCFRRYEVVRKGNRELERRDLAKLTLSDLYQRYVAHCGHYPSDPMTLGWQANGAAGARWFNQGRLMLSLMGTYGRPAAPVLHGAHS